MAIVSEQQIILELSQKHVGAELAADLETTMNMMTEEPHRHNIPTMASAYRQPRLAWWRRSETGADFGTFSHFEGSLTSAASPSGRYAPNSSPFLRDSERPTLLLAPIPLNFARE